jgi:Calponin homology (CH) domain
VAAAAREKRSDSVLTVGATVDTTVDDAQFDYPALMQWIATVTGEPFPSNSATTANTTASTAATAGTSAAAAFAQGLQDGVSLCSVLVALQLPGAAPASTSPLQYKKLENIARFVRAARTAGVPALHLFAPADLYEQSCGSAAAAARALHSLCLLLPAAVPSYTGPLLPVVESVAAGVAAAAAAARGSGATTTTTATDDMSDDDDPITAKSSATATGNTGTTSGTAAAADAVHSNSSSSIGEPLLDATLEQAFASLDITAQSGRLNAMQFASLWRVLTGQ